MKTQMRIEGFVNSTPTIKLISFRIKGKVQITLTDGRIIIVPVSAFPSIKKLNMRQRQKWYLFGNGFSFDDCDEVYHIEQILGNFDNFRHERQETASQK